jgi:hypothetical protein
MTVEFFQNNHGQENVVFLKAEQAHGVVQQYVGVQHKQFGRPRTFRFERSHSRFGFGEGL